jgi:hypothetical protein
MYFSCVKLQSDLLRLLCLLFLLQYRCEEVLFKLEDALLSAHNFCRIIFFYSPNETLDLLLLCFQPLKAKHFKILQAMSNVRLLVLDVK